MLLANHQLTLYKWAIKSPNLGFFLMMGVQSEIWTQNLTTITTKPSPHMMIKNDIEKDINTYFEWKIAFFFISLFDLIDLVDSLLH